MASNLERRNCSSAFVCLFFLSYRLVLLLFSFLSTTSLCQILHWAVIEVVYAPNGRTHLFPSSMKSSAESPLLHLTALFSPTSFGEVTEKGKPYEQCHTAIVTPFCIEYFILQRIRIPCGAFLTLFWEVDIVEVISQKTPSHLLVLVPLHASRS